jgi:uncharacterized surface anchored protein
MNLGQKPVLWAGLGAFVVLAASLPAAGQRELHGRKYQPPPATGHIVIQVEKEFNGKPMENAAVVFHSVKDGKDNGNLEIKTNSQGKAVMDLLETGSHVNVQVIASGYSTAAREFDLTDADQNLTIKMQRPRAQISVYADNEGKASPVQPGLQVAEHQVQTGVRPTTATVSGTLKDEHGGRIPGGVLRLKASATGTTNSMATDAEGNFKLNQLAPGTYDLQISAPGYATKTRHLSLSGGDNLIYQETMHPAPDPGTGARTPLSTGEPK